MTIVSSPFWLRVLQDIWSSSGLFAAISETEASQIRASRLHRRSAVGTEPTGPGNMDTPGTHSAWCQGEAMQASQTVSA